MSHHKIKGFPIGLRWFTRDSSYSPLWCYIGSWTWSRQGFIAKSNSRRFRFPLVYTYRKLSRKRNLGRDSNFKLTAPLSVSVPSMYVNSAKGIRLSVSQKCRVVIFHWNFANYYNICYMPKRERERQRLENIDPLLADFYITYLIFFYILSI